MITKCSSSNEDMGFNSVGLSNKTLKKYFRYLSVTDNGIFIPTSKYTTDRSQWYDITFVFGNQKFSL